MNDQDGHRLEAAEQFGFAHADLGEPGYFCTDAQLIAFAKACERAGRAQVVTILRETERKLDAAPSRESSLISGGISAVAEELEKRNAESDAELAPVLEVERAKGTPYELKAGEEIRDGKLYGWTGRDHAACNGTGEDFSDANAPYTKCDGCGGTGEEWGLMPEQPSDLQMTIASTLLAGRLP
jgi:hypothetical protein